MLAVELREQADLAAPADAATSRVSIGCEGAHVTIEIDDALTQKDLRRTLDLLGASPDARARLAALAIAELLAASWLELGMRRDVELAEAQPRTSSSEERRSLALDLARDRLVLRESTEEERALPRAPPFGIRAFAVGSHSGAQPAHFSAGGGLGIDAELIAPLAILIDARVEHSSADIGEIGTTRTQAAWAGAMLALRLPFDQHHSDFGLGARGGVGWLEGVGATGVGQGSHVGPLLSLIGAVHLSLHLANAAYAHIGVELGWVIVPLYGTLEPSGEIIARVGGFQAALTLGFEVRPD